MLTPRVLYRKYADYLYIINLNTSKSYLFEGIAGDLMDILADTETVNLDELTARIEEEYEVENSAQMRTEVEDFVKVLQNEGLLADNISAHVEKNLLN